MLFLIFALGLQAYAMELSVPIYPQNYSNWCWVASSAMVGRYYYADSIVDQYDICFAMHGNTFNYTASSSEEVARTVNYVTRNRKTYGVANYVYGASPPGFDLSKIQNEILQSQPLIGIVAMQGDGSDAHTWVISGYDSSKEKLVLINPAGGFRREFLWNEFIRGTSEYEPRPYKTAIYNVN